jgi:uncharacterized membrane protein YhhN
MKKMALVLYIVATVGVLGAELIQVQWLHMVCKPFLMISLLLYYLFSTDPVNRSRPLVLAIVFSFAGDVMLMCPTYFIEGLVAFLIAHVLYIFSYRQLQHDETINALQGLQRIRLAFPIVLAGTGLVVILYPALGDLKIPVIIYALILTVMVLNALFRFGRTSTTSFWMVFGGAVLFMISDSLLAVNKFLLPSPWGGFFIMLSYVLAQFLIVEGSLKHLHESDNK